eukprot:TRINITY_DN72769_c0_g1_i1.p1 TRINITY_DN72769_c0_g1~~TRINITY_DN72769_c0_g1_i1.p1  ORF type:complete len:301 (-),score=52.96 TRINITY_DN72769_c0_g1_i1:113-1015(-)
MAYFLNREEPPRQHIGKRCSGGVGGSGVFPGMEEQAAPSSPLARLVHEGYVGMPSGGRRGQQGGCQNGFAPDSYNGLPTGGRPPRAPPFAVGGFDAGIAQQWSGSVQQSQVEHQQQHDPNYVQLKPKTHGFKVSQSAGGNSSLSLAWEGAGAAEPPARRGLGQRAPSPGAGQRAPSPGLGGGATGSRASSRESGGMMGCLGGASYGDAAYQRQAPVSNFGGGGDPGHFGAPAPPAYGSYGCGGGGRQVEATSLAFGNRMDSGSSNAYACGSNQNVGNGITDRRTTRVLAPPGGSSQISFG